MIGVKATEDTLKVFNDMKLGKKVAYLIFCVEGAEIKVESSKTKEEVGDDYLDAFISEVKASGQPRFAVVDWNHKLCFVSWVPDTSKPKNKMAYASCKEAFVQELVGIQIKLQATDDGELSKAAINEKVKSNV